MQHGGAVVTVEADAGDVERRLAAGGLVMSGVFGGCWLGGGVPASGGA